MAFQELEDKKMTVQELIDILSRYNPDSEVRIMTQQSWPFENSVHGVCHSTDLVEDEDEPVEAPEDDGVVYIVEGRQLGYGSKVAWEAASRW